MLNESLLHHWVIINLIFSILKLASSCLLNSFLLFFFLEFNLYRLIVVPKLLGKTILDIFCGCCIVKFIGTDVKICLTKIRTVNMDRAYLIVLILRTESLFGRSFIGKNCIFYFSKRKVFFSCSFTKTAHIIWF